MVTQFKHSVRNTEFCFSLLQILTNVQEENTTAVLMLCAVTPKDLTTALVIRDTMETGGIVNQVNQISFCRISNLTRI